MRVALTLYVFDKAGSISAGSEHSIDAAEVESSSHNGEIPSAMSLKHIIQRYAIDQDLILVGSDDEYQEAVQTIMLYTGAFVCQPSRQTLVLASVQIPSFVSQAKTLRWP